MRLAERRDGMAPRETRDVEVGADGADVALEDLVLSLEPAGARLAGRVVGPDGAPLPRAAVTWHGEHPGQWGDGETDAEGRFEVKDLLAGELQLFARSGELVAPGPLAVRLSPDGPNEVVLRLGPGGALAGHVTAPAARLGGAGLTVYVEPAAAPDDAWLNFARRYEPIALDGGYRVAGLAPGRYEVMIPDATEGREVEVRAGETTRADIAIASAVEKVDVRFDGDLHRCQLEATVRWAAHDGVEAGSRFERPHDGALVVDFVPAGEVTVELSLRGPRYGWLPCWTWSREATVVAGEPCEVDFVGPADADDDDATGAIAGTADLGGEDEIFAIAYGGELRATTLVERGKGGAFAIDALPPGRYRLVLCKGAEPADRTGVEVDVRAGQTTRVERLPAVVEDERAGR
jgi:hypothetical protein